MSKILTSKNMKTIMVCIFVLGFVLCLVGCTDALNGPHIIEPYGEYSIDELYSNCPYQVTQEYDTKNKKFEVEASIPGVTGEPLTDFLKIPRIISLDNIKCDSYKELFNANVSDQYLKENYKALWFMRVENITADVLEDIVYLHLFVENYRVYVTINYNASVEFAGDAISYYEDLILIPNEWEEKIGKSKINFNLYNHFYSGTRIIMSYSKMQEFKDAYREQILNNEYDDQLYREIYMLDVYGEYNDCLVSTVTYDGYVHPTDIRSVTDTFEDVSITYSLYYPIWVCKNSKLYTLKEAYDNGYLTIDNLRDISKK